MSASPQQLVLATYWCVHPHMPFAAKFDHSVRHTVGTEGLPVFKPNPKCFDGIYTLGDDHNIGWVLISADFHQGLSDIVQGLPGWPHAVTSLSCKLA